MKSLGQLYLVSTPIGNLRDITLRALEVLQEVEEIVCESTKTALKLLNHYSISKPLTHLSEENQLFVVPKIIEKLKKGKKIALISDAGTPTISDPGQFLVQKAIGENIKIIPIPGPSAILSALVASGLSTSSFLFLGFLPKKSNQKREIFETLKNLKINKKHPTVIFFESPHRLLETLNFIEKIYGKRISLSVGREMTKIFEEFIRGKIDEVIKKIKQKKEIKGEITVVLSLKELS